MATLKTFCVDESESIFVEESGCAPHLTGLYATEWAAWKWIFLRGAGFPLRLLNKLSVVSAVTLSEQIIALEGAFKTRLQQTIATLMQELKATNDEQRRTHLQRLLRPMMKGRLPGNVGDLCESWARDLRQLQEQKRKALLDFEKQFEIEVKKVSTALAEIAAENRFQRAVLLQNASAIRCVVRSLGSSSRGAQTDRGSKKRQHEELVASYLQRYCAKNDTIGFFGPVGWAKFVSDPISVTTQPGMEMIEASSIYFEQWCVEALAAKISADQDYRPWIAPRLLPFFYLEGSRLHLPGGSSIVLDPVKAAILAKCDGLRSARQIGLELIMIPGSGIRSEADAYRTLQQLVDRHIISWKLELPFDLYPEKRLRTLLQRIEKDDLRLRAVQDLQELEMARERVAAASTQSKRLDEALSELGAIFTRLTGQGTSRNEGKMYAARTLVYNDCRRDLRMEVGSMLTQALGEPLSLMLASGRWFTYRAAQYYRHAFRLAYRELVARSSRTTLDALHLWTAIQPLVSHPEKRLLNRLVPELQALWLGVLDLPWDQNHVHYKSAELRAKVEKTFTAPGPGWRAAQYHSPDVMIAASDLDAIQRGDFLLVLGELHMAANTVRGSFAMSQHPCPKEMVEAIAADLPGAHILPVPSPSWPGLTARTHLALTADHHYRLEMTPDSISPASRAQTLPISAFIVEDTAQGLVVRTRDGKLSFDPIEFLGEALSVQAVECMKILPVRPHSPRITIDRLVVNRESWRISGTEMGFINEKSESARFLGARRWMRRKQLPRYVFAKVHVEDKPSYVDFDSPVYVEIFIKMVRRVLASDRPQEDIVISEMLPAPGQVWLSDFSGEKYTSELRIVAVDQTTNSMPIAGDQRQ